MKLMNKIWLPLALLVAGVYACEKKDTLPLYAEGKAAVLTASAAAIAPPAADSNKTIITFSWNNPLFATDSNTAKYVLEIDSAGRNFKSANVRTITGSLSSSFLAKELNTIMLNWGFEYNKTYDLDARVTASYTNNNDRKVSNTVRIKATTYKIPPKVAVPTTGKLFIVGSATVGNWANPVPLPDQEFSRIDETTFAGVFYLYGGGQYLVLPENGQWKKYSVADNSITGLSNGGAFGAELKDNFPAPVKDSLYTVTMDFQQGKFAVVPYDDRPYKDGLPQVLVAVGDATPLGWANPAQSSLMFTRKNKFEFSLVMYMITGKEYLILPEPGKWDRKFGVADNSIEAGKLGGSLKRDGQNLKAPNVSGNYRIDINFANNSYKLTLIP